MLSLIIYRPRMNFYVVELNDKMSVKCKRTDLQSKRCVDVRKNATSFVWKITYTTGDLMASGI